MIFIVAAIAGGLATLSVVSSFDLLLAFVAAPVGGSVLAGLAAVYIAFRRANIRLIRTPVVPAVEPQV